MKPLVHILLLITFLNKISNDRNFLHLACFKSLGVVGDKFIVVLEYYFLLDVVMASLFYQTENNQWRKLTEEWRFYTHVLGASALETC